MDVSLPPSLSFSFPSSLSKINKHMLRCGFKKREREAFKIEGKRNIRNKGKAIKVVNI